MRFRTTTKPAVSTGSDTHTVATVMATQAWPRVLIGGRTYTLKFKDVQMFENVPESITATLTNDKAVTKTVLRGVDPSATVASLLSSLSF